MGLWFGVKTLTVPGLGVRVREGGFGKVQGACGDTGLGVRI